MNKPLSVILFGTRRRTFIFALSVMLSAVLLFTVCSDSGTGTGDPGADLCVASPGSQACCAAVPTHSSCSQASYSLSTSVSPPGSGTVTPPSGLSHAAGVPVTIAATPTAGYSFVNWTAMGSGVVDEPTMDVTTITLSGTTSLVANFVLGENPCVASPGSAACCTATPTHTSCTSSDPCVANPGSAACCAATPTHASCTSSDPCVANPGSTACCTANPQHTSCIIVDPICEMDPGSAACCAYDPTHASCTSSDPCVANPGSAACCAATPTHASCTTADPCVADPGSAACCATTPTHASCTPPDPCDANPGSAACCAATPSHASCTPPDPCDANPGSAACCAATPTHASCTPPDPCVTNPGGAACCTATPTHASCPDPCAADPGSAYCCMMNPTHASCIVVPPDPCDASPGSSACCTPNPGHPSCVSNPCITNPGSTACCTATPTHSSCVATGEHWCWWEAANPNCNRITNPNDVDPNSPAGLTFLANCQAHGQYFPSQSACQAYVPPTTQDWCYWTSPTPGCFRINNPDAMDNTQTPPITNRQVCINWGEHFTSEAACLAYTPPAINYYCDWSNATNANNCWNIRGGTQPCDSSGGACTGTAIEHCRASGTVVQCTGTDRPDGGACCVGTRQ